MAVEQMTETVEQDTLKPDGQASNPQAEGEKMVSVSEMNRRLDKANKNYEIKVEQAIQEALDKYKAESELSGKELEAYRKKEAEAEKQKLLDKIADLEKAQTKRELTDEAIKSLSSRKLPVNDKVLAFVVKDTAENTLEAIKDFESIISDIKVQSAQSAPPNISSNDFGGESTKSRSDVFRESRII